MELVLSAISSGGLVGAANQYLCLIIISVAAKSGPVRLAPQVSADSLDRLLAGE